MNENFVTRHMMIACISFIINAYLICKFSAKGTKNYAVKMIYYYKYKLKRSQKSKENYTQSLIANLQPNNLVPKAAPKTH